jgi:hypothetical protein
MYRPRSRGTTAAIAFLSACIVAVPLASGDNLGGCWHVEGEVTHYAGLRTVYVYGHYDDIIDVRLEPIVDPDPPLRFKGQAYVVQTGNQLEGRGSRDVPCGENPEVEYAGTVFEDNRLELTATIPGLHEYCEPNELRAPSDPNESCEFQQTDWVAFFHGTYDPYERVITGTFDATQEQDDKECWASTWHTLAVVRDTVQSGTLKISVGCTTCDRASPWQVGLPDLNKVTCGQRVIDPCEADSGERLEFWCSGDGGKHYEVKYFRPRSDKEDEGFRIAKCWFNEATNYITYMGIPGTPYLIRSIVVAELELTLTLSRSCAARQSGVRSPP